MNVTVADPADDACRVAALRRQSDDCLRDARSGALNCPAQAFFQAGYVALLATLSADEVKTFPDQPNAAAVALAAGRVPLALTDQALAERGVRTYYSPDPLGFGSAEEWSAWAARARQAVGWDDGMLTA